MTKSFLNLKFLIPAGITMAMLAVTLSLGFWQIDRMVWKRGILEKIEAQQLVNPSKIRLIDDIDSARNEFKRGYLTGVWQPEKNVKVGPQILEGKLGYWLVTPLVLSDGTALFVNRGWAPGNMIDMLLGSAPPHGIVTLTGTLRKPQAGKGAVAGDSKSWHELDVDAIAAAHGIVNYAPMALFMDGSTPADETSLVPAPILPNLRNEHLNYAIFWFGMSLVIGVVFVLSVVLPNLQETRSASSQGPSAP